MSPDTDYMQPDMLLNTLRGLLNEAHAEQDSTRAAVKAMAAVHIMHVLDVMVSAGHPLPAAWAQGSNDAH